MRKALLIGLSTMLMGSVFVTEASAQGAPSAGGSCGYEAGSYGLNSLSPIDIRNPNRGAMNLGRWHWQVTYSNVSPGTVLTIVPGVGSLQTGPNLTDTGTGIRTTAAASSGSFAGSSAQNENGAERFGRRGLTTNKSAGVGRGPGKGNGFTPSASQSNGAGLYFFTIWAGDQQIGQFNCAIADR